MNNAVLSARELLEGVTPLKRDCGSLCACACCQGDEQTGMLLFPGEETLYEGCGFGRVVTAHYELAGRRALLFVCDGHCERGARPLSCRLFPLFLRFTKGDTRVAIDPRAASVCPLAGYGLEALNPAFVHAARNAYDILLGDEDCAAFLRALDAELTL